MRTLVHGRMQENWFGSANSGKLCGQSVNRRSGLMATVLANLDEIKTAVINSLQNQTRRPIELLDSLSKDYPDGFIKEAVLRLLQEGEIEFTADRLLREKERTL